jgi:outer membrane immunogenic protein
MNKTMFLAGLGLAALVAGPALGADMARPAPVYKAAPMPAPAYTWTGCYIGGNIGWGRDDHRYTAANGVDEGSHSSDGFVGGGQVGCDYQFASNWVIGIQGLADWADFSGSNASIPVPANIFHSHTRWFGTVTGRLGFLFAPSFMVYGKAGWGWVNDKNDLRNTAGVVTAVGDKDNFSGVDAGGGLEWMFAPNWSLWVEYDHIFRDTNNLTYAVVGGGSFQEHVRRDFDKVLVGINWRFGGVGGPVRAAY